MVIVFGLAAAFELAGLLLAFIGMTQTWSSYGPGGNLLRAPPDACPTYCLPVLMHAIR